MVMCGRDAVQISPAQPPSFTLDALAKALAALGKVTYQGHVLRLELAEQELLVFPDGRAIVKGTSDPGIARSLYARYIGT